MMILRSSEFQAELERSLKVVQVRHMTQLLVNNFGKQKSCVKPHPPLRETDVTKGGMGRGGAVALLVPLSSTIV
jgi:hypothetical protein